MKVMIAVPCMDQIPARFAQSLAMLQRPEGCEIIVGFQVGSLVYSSRNTLAKNAVKEEADYVLWLDSDMVFPPDFLIRMLAVLKEKKLDFLSALYFRRNPPYSPVLFDLLDVTETGCDFNGLEKVPEEIFEVKGCGFGGVLMDTSVIIDVAAKYGRMFDPFPGVGEDLSFCWRARECGYTLYCDPSFKMGHVGYAVITEDYYNAFRRIDNAGEA